MAGFMTGFGDIVNYAFNSLDMTSSANDIIVIQHADGTLHSSPFIVRFGKVKVLRPQDKVVTIEINGQPTTAVMKIASDGTAYWVHSSDGANVGPYDSPMASPPQSPSTAASHPYGAPPPPMGVLGGDIGLSPSLLPSNPPPGVRPPPSPAMPSAAVTCGSEPPPARLSPTEPAPPPLPAADANATTTTDANGSGTDGNVKRLDDALPADLLVGSTSKPEARPVEGLLTSLAAEAAATPSASNLATPSVTGMFHHHQEGGAAAAAAGGVDVGGGALPPPMVHHSTDDAAHDGGDALEASEFSRGGGSGGGLGGLRLARLASTDMLDNLPLGQVSLNEDPAAAAAWREEAAAAAEEVNAQLALQRSLHADPNTGVLDDATAAAEEAEAGGAAAQPAGAADLQPSSPSGALGASLDTAGALSDEFSDCDDAFEPQGGGGGSANGANDDGAALSGRASAEGPAYTRSVFASHHDLTRLNLNPGANTIRFSTGTTLRGKVDITATIFLWSEGAKLVVSDVDGTVTKSDVMGHIATFFGKDWTHPGLCSLYSKIANNGYHFVYLTARSVSQVEQTRQFLFNVEQDGMRLPHGPVLTAPEKLFSALQQELSKKSHEFKIACLAQVRDAFPLHVKPFYAGFGNRIGDVIAYTASEISEHKIFIINKDSVIHICTVKRSYRDLSHMVDETFPARRTDDAYLQEMHELRCAAAAFNEGASANTLRRSADGGSSAEIGGVIGGGSTERSASPGSDGSASASHLRAVTPTPAAAAAPRRSTGTKASVPEAPAEYNDFNFWRVDPASMVEPIPAPKPLAQAASRTPPKASPAGAPSVSAPPSVGVTTADATTPQAQSRGWLGGLWGGSKAAKPATAAPATSSSSAPGSPSPTARPSEPVAPASPEPTTEGAK